MDPGPCKAESATTSETATFRCPYVFEGLGSKELGLGPYNGSTYVISVRDGAVIGAVDQFAFANNGYAIEVWEPFAADGSPTSYPEDALRDVRREPHR